MCFHSIVSQTHLFFLFLSSGVVGASVWNRVMRVRGLSMVTGPSGHPGLLAHEVVKVESPIETGSAMTPGREIYNNSLTDRCNDACSKHIRTAISKIVNISNWVITCKYFAFLRRIRYKWYHFSSMQIDIDMLYTHNSAQRFYQEFTLVCLCSRTRSTLRHMIKTVNTPHMDVSLHQLSVRLDPDSSVIQDYLYCQSARGPYPKVRGLLSGSAKILTSVGLN